ncbi:MAG: hypothetical protein HY665_09070 [Chloroflexi bacterium]|nr:hypothetical protein [Chloroflexota bacterium]
MGFFGKLSGRHLVDVMRLDIHMSFSPVLGGGRGSAYVEWVPLSYDEPRLRPFLICLFYARILTIHEETRAQLFCLIDELSKSNVRDEGRTGFQFEEWAIQIRGVLSQHSRQYIWPWTLFESPNALDKPKVYQATMRASSEEPDFFVIALKMAFGQERILAPSSFLIAMHSYCKTIDQQGFYELAMFLWQINEYYKSPDHISIGRESLALKAAFNAVRSGNLATP